MAYIKLTRRANLDLVAIYDYSIEQWGEHIANEYINGLQNVLLLLQDNPKLLTYNPTISSRFQCFRHQKHWLICETIGNVIIVLTVLHTSMNLLENLRKYEPSLEQEAETLYKRLKN